jgi:hypothetical protein
VGGSDDVVADGLAGGCAMTFANRPTVSAGFPLAAFGGKNV